MPKGYIPYLLEGQIATEEDVAKALEFINIYAFRKWKEMVELNLPMDIQVSELIVRICNLEEEVKELKNRQMERGRS